jgi:hypothetical protein
MIPRIRPFYIDRRVLLGHLAEADRHIADGEKQLAKQEELVVELESQRLDTKQARAVLATMTETQTLFHQHRELVLSELEG